MKKKKRRIYTEKELGVPTLNMITPVGVEKPKGKKKGKVFVDDRVRPLQVPPSHLALAALSFSIPQKNLITYARYIGIHDDDPRNGERR